MAQNNLIVLGRLGDLAKKMIELDMQLEVDAKNSGLKVEVDAHTQVVMSWPCQDRFSVDVQITTLKLLMQKLVAAEEEVRASHASRSSNWDWEANEMMVKNYILQLDKCRAAVQELNKAGRSGGMTGG